MVVCEVSEEVQGWLESLDELLRAVARGAEHRVQENEARAGGAVDLECQSLQLAGIHAEARVPVGGASRRPLAGVPVLLCPLEPDAEVEVHATAGEGAEFSGVLENRDHGAVFAAERQQVPRVGAARPLETVGEHHSIFRQQPGLDHAARDLHVDIGRHLVVGAGSQGRADDLLRRVRLRGKGEVERGRVAELLDRAAEATAHRCHLGADVRKEGDLQRAGHRVVGQAGGGRSADLEERREVQPVCPQPASGCFEEGVEPLALGYRRRGLPADPAGGGRRRVSRVHGVPWRPF